MNPESDEAELKKLFRDRKESDERHAPSFAHTWQAASSRTTEAPPTMRWLAPAILVATLAIVATAVGIMLHARMRESQPAQAASLNLTPWQSPTAFLLTTTDSTLLTSVPSLDQSWMQDMSYLTEKFE